MAASRVTVVVADSGDWSALFLGDELIDENHSISTWAWLDLLNELGVEVERIWDVPFEDLNLGRCGESLAAFKEEVAEWLVSRT